MGGCRFSEKIMPPKIQGAGEGKFAEATSEPTILPVHGEEENMAHSHRLY
jgi:hypothetical protein